MKLLQRLILFAAGVSSAISYAGECTNWQTNHPDWIFCDDFESGTALVSDGRYHEVDNGGGEFVLQSGAGLDGSKGMRAVYRPGREQSGYLCLATGRNPVSTRGVSMTETFRELYVRVYLRMQTGWQGNPMKTLRLNVFSDNNRSQAAIAHLWQSDATGSNCMALDLARCVDPATNQVQCQGWNDFAHLEWFCNRAGNIPLYATANSNKWYCIEYHVKLNGAGQSNGQAEFWINDTLQGRGGTTDNLNFVYGYSQYGINDVYFENFWNSGLSPQIQERYWDNVVISRSRIGPITPPTIIRSDVVKRGVFFSLQAISTPFNASTVFYVDGPATTPVDISVFRITGKKVAEFNSVNGRVIWDASREPDGIYLARMNAGGKTLEKRIVLAR